MTRAISGPLVAATPERASYRIFRCNQRIYEFWSTISICRLGAFSSSIAAFFKCPGLEKAASNARDLGLLFGSVAAAAEMAVTAVIFRRSVRDYQNLSKQVDDRLMGRNTLAQFCTSAKERGPDSGIPLPIACGEDYFQYETAKLKLGSATTNLKLTAITFTRDTGIQGAGVGANLATLWAHWNVSDLLHLGRCAVDTTAAGAVSFASSIGSGLFHIVGGVAALLVGKKSLANALARLARRTQWIKEGIIGDGTPVDTAAEAFIGKLIAKKGETPGKAEKYQQIKSEVTGGLHAAGESVARTQFERAITLSKQLFSHAGRNAERAEKDAQHQILVGKLRITYGAVATALGVAGLTVFLLLGVTPIGWAIGAVGALASLGWLAYASRRNRQYAEALVAVKQQQAPDERSPEQVVDEALSMFSEYGKGTQSNALARKLVKQTLLDIGLTVEDFRVLKFCPESQRADVVRTLRAKALHYMGG